MKRMLPILLILACAPRPAAAAMERIYHDLLDADVAAKKTTVMQKVLPLTGEDATEFQKILSEYEEERGRLQGLRNELVQEYAAVGPSMSDDISEAMMKQFMDLDAKEMALKQKTLDKIVLKLGGRAAAQFYLADTKLDLIAYLQILARLPFVR